jgi:hypothetical protein
MFDLYVPRRVYVYHVDICLQDMCICLSVSIAATVYLYIPILTSLSAPHYATPHRTGTTWSPATLTT